MTEKKIKRLSVRLSLEDYLYLKNTYLLTKMFEKDKHKSFSAYIRYLLELGISDYY